MTEEELKAIEAMKIATKNFYCAAIGTGVHAFIEFAGLMNEYISICESSPGFMTANVHTNQALSMLAHQAAYLAQKLDCIYGSSLRADPYLAKVMLGRCASFPPALRPDLGDRGLRGEK